MIHDSDYGNLFPHSVDIYGIPGDGQTSIVLQGFYGPAERLP